MSQVKQEYLKNKDNEVISPIVSPESIISPEWNSSLKDKLDDRFVDYLSQCSFNLGHELNGNYNYIILDKLTQHVYIQLALNHGAVPQENREIIVVLPDAILPRNNVVLWSQLIIEEDPNIGIEFRPSLCYIKSRRYPENERGITVWTKPTLLENKNNGGELDIVGDYFI